MLHRFILLFCMLLPVTGGIAQEQRPSCYGRSNVQAQAPHPAKNAADLVAPDTLYIGLTRMGKCDTVTIPLHNTGPDTIRIDTAFIDINSAPSEALKLLLPLPAQLSAGEKANLSIVFCPVASGCIDGELVIHFKEEIGGLPSQHRANIHACAGAPQFEVNGSTLDFGNVPIAGSTLDSIILFNRGTFPLGITGAATHNEAFTIVEGPVSFPFTIPPDDSVWLYLRFSPRLEKAYQDSLTFTVLADIPVPKVHLLGQGHAPDIRVPELVEFGELAEGACRDTTILLRNTAEKTWTVQSVTLPDNAATFELVAPMPSSLPRLLGHADTMMLHLRYCARSTGPAVEEMEVKIDALTFRTIITGTGVTPTLRLDTTTTTPGNIARLNLRLGPGLHGVELGSYSITLQVPKAALSMVQAQSANGMAIQAVSGTNGTIKITGESDSIVIIDDLLAQIDLRGLSSGEAFNTVALMEAEFTGLDSTPRFLHGGVYLEGCDITHPFQLGPRLAVRSARQESSGLLTVTCVVPQGAATLSLFDAAGRLLARRDLEAGTEAEQQTQLAAELTGGEPCFIELRSRSERVVIPVALSR